MPLVDDLGLVLVSYGRSTHLRMEETKLTLSVVECKMCVWSQMRSCSDGDETLHGCCQGYIMGVIKGEQKRANLGRKTRS